MEYLVNETPEMTLYKADTDETFKELSVDRAVEIINDTCEYFQIDLDLLQEVDPESGEPTSNVGDFIEGFLYAYGDDVSAFCYDTIEVDRELAIRALAGMFIEREWETHPSNFSGGTPQRELLRDYLRRKVQRLRRTEWVLVDVTPHHPLQELAKRQDRGELEKFSDEWKIAFAKAFEGYCPKGPFREAYDYAEEFNLDINFADEVDAGPLVS